MLSGPFHSFLSYGAHISPHVNSVNITDYLFVHFLVNTYTTVRLFFSLPKSVSWVGDDDAAMRSSLTPKQQHRTINRLIVWYALLKVMPNEHDKHEHRSCCRRKKTTTKNRRLENAQHTICGLTKCWLCLFSEFWNKKIKPTRKPWKFANFRKII